MSNLNAELVTAIAALIEGKATKKPETKKPAKQEKKPQEQIEAEKDERRWYDPIETTRQNIASDVPQSLRDELESYKKDQTIGENQRQRLIAACEQEIREMENSGLSIVLESMREEKRTPRTRHTTRILIQQGDHRITLRAHELALILKHGAPLKQWLHDTAMSGMMDN